MFRGKTVAITGAAGFLGAQLARRLEREGARILAIDNFAVGPREALQTGRGGIEVIPADIRRREALERVKEANIVYHLAAIANPRTCNSNFELAFDVNVQGLKNTLECSKQAERFVFLSTIMVYGDPLHLPIDERHATNGADNYSISKIIGENLVRSYGYSSALPYAIIRNSNSFGPLQSRDYLVPTLIYEALTKPQIEIWNPKAVRDFMYAENTLDALVRVAESDAVLNETMNLGSGQGVSVGHLGDIISKEIGTTWVDAKRPLAAAGKLVCDVSKLKALTGWEPRVSLEEGLRRTISYWKQVVDGNQSAEGRTPASWVGRE